MRRHWLAAVISGAIAGPAFVLSSSLAPAAIRAQGGPAPQKTVKDGVFTEAQAERGKQAYETNSCIRCHLDTLEGREQGGGGNGGAPLKGLRFVQDFGETKLSTLVNKMRVDKPMENPGTLSEQAALDIAAYILLKNDYLPGRTELTTEAAGATWIPGPPGATGIPTHTVVSSVGCLYHDPTDSWLLTKALALTPSPSGGKTVATPDASSRTHTFRLLDAYNRDALSHANHIVKVEGYLVRLGAEIRISLTSLERVGGSCLN
jgi:cytochrome c553